jgi:hypothetical protein
MTLLVRDEEEIIEDNLDFHLRHGVDFVIVTDNRSEDRTPAIVERYVRRGVARLITETDDDYDQTAWVTRMARLAAVEHGADWVINADADEFWWPKGGDLRQALAMIPANVGVVEVDRSNFIPVDGEGPFHQQMVVRQAVSYGPLGDPLQPKVCHRGHAGVEVAQGNHSVTGVPGRTLKVTAASPLFILHFPLRSYAQFERKIISGGQAYERNTKVPWDTGSGWRSRYEDYQAGTLRAWWEKQLMDPVDVAAGVGSGSLVLDRRLATFFCPSGKSRTLPVEAAAPDMVPAARVNAMARPANRQRSWARRRLAKASRPLRRHLRQRLGR